jgi:uncharacterized surface protein with fasciclin (FAS1) repeats
MLRSFVFAAASTLLAASHALAQTPPAASDPVAATSASPPAAPATTQIITPNPSADIVANLKASGQFTTFLKAADASGLTPLLQKPGALTVFVPTDAAFAALPADVLANLMKPGNSAQLQQVVAYHIVNTKLLPSQVIGHAATPVPSVVNKPITIDGSSTPIKVNDADVVQAGAPASNGVIYVIDKVLMAPQ